MLLADVSELLYNFLKNENFNEVSLQFKKKIKSIKIKKKLIRQFEIFQLEILENSKVKKKIKFLANSTKINFSFINHVLRIISMTIQKVFLKYLAKNCTECINFDEFAMILLVVGYVCPIRILKVSNFL